MKCSESERLMSALLDGDLEGSPRLDAHLAECSACSELFEALLATVGDLHELSVPEVSDDLTARVLAALPAPTRSALWIKGLSIGWGATCALAAVGLALVGLWRIGLLPYLLTTLLAGLNECAKMAVSALAALGYGGPGFVVNLWLLSGSSAAALLLIAAATRAYSIVTSPTGKGVRQ